MPLVPDAGWGDAVTPGDRSGEGLPQGHLGLPQARGAPWRCRQLHTNTGTWGPHQSPPARKADRLHTQAPHLPSLCPSALSQRSGRTSTRR